jgi:peptidyl-tRNA hydrolase
LTLLLAALPGAGATAAPSGTLTAVQEAPAPESPPGPDSRWP